MFISFINRKKERNEREKIIIWIWIVSVTSCTYIAFHDQISLLRSMIYRLRLCRPFIIISSFRSRQIKLKLLNTNSKLNNAIGKKKIYNLTTCSTYVYHEKKTQFWIYRNIIKRGLNCVTIHISVRMSVNRIPKKTVLFPDRFIALTISWANTFRCCHGLHSLKIKTKFTWIFSEYHCKVNIEIFVFVLAFDI